MNVYMCSLLRYQKHMLPELYAFLVLLLLLMCHFSAFSLISWVCFGHKFSILTCKFSMYIVSCTHCSMYVYSTCVCNLCRKLQCTKYCLVCDFILMSWMISYMYKTPDKTEEWGEGKKIRNPQKVKFSFCFYECKPHFFIVLWGF